MFIDSLKGQSVNILTDRFVEDRRQSTRQPLMLAAWIWLAETPDEPIAIRLLDHSPTGVGFVCSLPLAKGDRFELGLEREGQRHTGLHVTYCEFYGADTFRVGAQSSSGPG
jgi:hypothetical protein